MKKKRQLLNVRFTVETDGPKKADRKVWGTGAVLHLTGEDLDLGMRFVMSSDTYYAPEELSRLANIGDRILRLIHALQIDHLKSEAVKCRIEKT